MSFVLYFNFFASQVVYVFFKLYFDVIALLIRELVLNHTSNGQLDRYTDRQTDGETDQTGQTGQIDKQIDR